MTSLIGDTPSPTRPGVVYALYDVRALGDYRYVGKTVRPPANRLWDHRHDKSKGRRYLKHWVRKIGPHNVRLIVLGAYSLAELDDAECMWIAALRAAGCCLTNTASGGQTSGVPKGYFTQSPETRAQISRSLKAKYASGTRRPNPKMTSDQRRASSERSKLQKRQDGRFVAMRPCT